ncbi:MAG: CBS domain-containing protein [Planctomycetes bacterium]|nr:CBS domain-containing protein [Planctomycetota bacterium]
MNCPDCGHDNIPGVDTCEECEQPLVEFDPSGNELEKSISRHAIEVLSPKSPVTVESSISLKEAVARMVERNIGCLLVVDNDVLVGIVTERDVLNHMASAEANLDALVFDVMTQSPTTITSQDSIAYTLHAMDLGGYRHMPIVDDTGRPHGIISVRDILRFLCVRFAETRSAAN